RLARHLLHQQARFGGGRQHAPAAALLDEAGEVRLRVEAEYRELEAVLPLGLAVAAGGVTREAAEKRDDGRDEVVLAGWRVRRGGEGGEQQGGEHGASGLREAGAGRRDTYIDTTSRGGGQQAG